MTKKTIINDILIEITKDYIKKEDLNNAGIDALYMSQLTNMERSNSSKELNRLWKEGLATKIQGYPIRYISKPTIMEFYDLIDFPSIILKDESITSFTNSTNHFGSANMYMIDQIIGADSSISTQINDAKAAITYPPHGISLLIIGNSGLNKKSIVSSLHQYARLVNAKQTNAKFIYINCVDYTTSINDIYAALVGIQHEKHQGFIEQSKKGTIYLDNIHMLEIDKLNKILEIIEHGYYSKINSSTLITLDCTIIASISPIYTEIINHLKRFFPSVITIPDIENRGLFEKIEQILTIFLQESVIIKKNIQISKDLLVILASHVYDNNLIGIRYEVKRACARAYLKIQPSNTGINLSYDSLSANIISNYDPYSKNVLSIKSLLSSINSDFILFESSNKCQILDEFKSKASEYNMYRFDQFLQHLDLNLDSLTNEHDFIYEIITTINNCGNVLQRKILQSINPYLIQVFEDVISKTDYFELYQVNSKQFLGLILHISNLIKQNKNNYSATIISTANISQSKRAAYLIAQTIGKEFKVSFSAKEINFISIYLEISEQWSKKTYVPILLIFHGKTIASELEEQIKQSYGEKFPVYSINYNSSIQFNDLLELALYKCKEINNGQGILIITDDHPLSNISEYIFNNSHIYTNTISSVSYALLNKICTDVKKFLTLDQIVYENRKTVSNLSIINDFKESNNFIYKLTKQFIEPTLSFLNAEKAVDTLMISLSNILKELKLEYSNEITTKFLCHSVNMIERTIRNDPFKYPQLNTFIQNNTLIFRKVEHNLSNINEVFGIHIVKDEIAYITEIFL